MALAFHHRLDGGGGSDQGELEAVHVDLEDEDVVLPQSESLPRFFFSVNIFYRGSPELPVTAKS
jgi:hypothetical protein